MLSALVNHQQKWTSVVDTIASAFGFIIFEYYAINAAVLLGKGSAFFLVNQLLAIIFLIATFYGTRTVRHNLS